MAAESAEAGNKTWGGFISYAYPFEFVNRVMILPGFTFAAGRNLIRPGNLPDDYQSQIPPGTDQLELRQGYYSFSPTLKTGIEVGKNPALGLGIFFQAGY